MIYRRSEFWCFISFIIVLYSMLTLVPMYETVLNKNTFKNVSNNCQFKIIKYEEESKADVLSLLDESSKWSFLRQNIQISNILNCIPQQMKTNDVNEADFVLLDIHMPLYFHLNKPKYTKSILYKFVHHVIKKLGNHSSKIIVDLGHPSNIKRKSFPNLKYNYKVMVDSMLHGFGYNSKRDLIIPYYVSFDGYIPSSHKSILLTIVLGSGRLRRTLVGRYGKYKNSTQEWFKVIGFGHALYNIKDRVPKVEYLKQIDNSRYCMTTGGDTPSTAKFYEFLKIHCTPILIGNSMILPPSFEPYVLRLYEYPQLNEAFKRFLMNLNIPHIPDHILDFDGCGAQNVILNNLCQLKRNAFI